VQPVDIYEVGTRWKRKGLFGRSEPVADIATPIGWGWILGEFKWRYTNLDIYEFGNFLTALLDTELSDAPYRVSNYHGLVCVQSYSDGCRILWNKEFVVGNLDGVWKELMQAVKRLIGESS
jgi:hypothetical protein